MIKINIYIYFTFSLLHLKIKADKQYVSNIPMSPLQFSNIWSSELFPSPLTISQQVQLKLSSVKVEQKQIQTKNIDKDTDKQQNILISQSSPPSFEFLSMKSVQSTKESEKLLLPDELQQKEEQKEILIEERQLLYAAFNRSYNYFQKIINNIQDNQLSLNQNLVIDPLQKHRQSFGVCKGLFCANRECCSLILDSADTQLTQKSPYCCKNCQVREQNMRQGRVKYRECMLRRKESLLNFMTTLKQTEFEVNKIVRIVTLFLEEYSKEYGKL